VTTETPAVERGSAERPLARQTAATSIQNDSGLPQKCRTQAGTSTCAVKRSHLAALAAKGFFGKCQKPEWGHSPFPLADARHAAVEIRRVEVHLLHAYDRTMQHAIASSGRFAISAHDGPRCVADQTRGVSRHRAHAYLPDSLAAMISRPRVVTGLLEFVQDRPRLRYLRFSVLDGRWNLFSEIMHVAFDLC
jgi:hypothetical protein